jgi:hypothetical protein
VALTDTFTAFLRKRAGRDEMAAALERSGHSLEASLLAGSAEGWVGSALPAAAEPGDLWLDVTELMPMVLTPDGWLALRPVERWQVGAFLDRAKFAGGPRRIGELTPLDGARLLAGDEREPVTRVLRDEAALYALWFGKSIAHRIDWQLAAEALGPSETAKLWGPVREWADAEYDDAYRVLDAELIDFDPDDEYPPVLVLGATDAPADVGFRTFVDARTGLLTSATETDSFGLGVRTLAPREPR